MSKREDIDLLFDVTAETNDRLDGVCNLLGVGSDTQTPIISQLMERLNKLELQKTQKRERDYLPSISSADAEKIRELIDRCGRILDIFHAHGKRLDVIEDALTEICSDPKIVDRINKSRLVNQVRSS